MSVNPKHLITAEETAAHAVDTVNPESPAQHSGSVDADPEMVEYRLDPQMIEQARQNKNARLIAMMVNENAMLEVALEQERRASGEARAKLQALQQVLAEMRGGSEE